MIFGDISQQLFLVMLVEIEIFVILGCGVLQQHVAVTVSNLPRMSNCPTRYSLLFCLHFLKVSLLMIRYHVEITCR